MEKALSYIYVLPSAKSEVSIFASQIIGEVESGNINPIELKIRLKWIERLIDAIDKPIKDAVLREASKFGKRFEHNGFRIEETETGTSYDYSNDVIWNTLKEKIKEREAFLKTLKEPLSIVDEETGEITICVPPIKKSTTSLRFTAI